MPIIEPVRIASHESSEHLQLASRLFIDESDRAVKEDSSEMSQFESAGPSGKIDQARRVPIRKLTSFRSANSRLYPFAHSTQARQVSAPTALINVS